MSAATITISPTSPKAWMMSIALHGGFVALLLFIAYTSRLQQERMPKILELVAGPGEDYGAKEAPALGTEAGVKLAIATPTPQPALPQPQAAPPPSPPVQDTSPVIPAPPVKKEVTKAPPVKKEADPATNFARQIQRKVDTAKKKAQVEAAKDRKKEQDRLTKEQFDRENAARKVASATSKSSPTKFKEIDVKGIRDGVSGGSSASKAGAGGKAMIREDGTLLQLYDSEFLHKLRRAFEEDRPPGLSDSLRVTIDVRSNADGSLTGAKVTEPSGSPEFDRAVLNAVKRVRMPARPDKRSETISFVFTMREGAAR